MVSFELTVEFGLVLTEQPFRPVGGVGRSLVLSRLFEIKALLYEYLAYLNPALMLFKWLRPNKI